MKPRSLPAFALVLAIIMSAAAFGLAVYDRLPEPGSGHWPWDVRAILQKTIQDTLKSDDTRAMIEGMFPGASMDREALVKDFISTIGNSEEARQVLAEALYTPEARQAFADALRSPEAERAIREVLATPRIRKLVTDLVKESLTQGS